MKKSESVQVRITPYTKRKWVQAAEDSKTRSLSQFIVTAVTEKVKEVNQNAKTENPGQRKEV